MEFLKNNGYEILEENYRSGRAEIDIIASRDELVIFVEVKTRKDTGYGEPQEFLEDDQIERIHIASEAYMDDNPWINKIRFDIISIILKGVNSSIIHFEDAF